MGSYVISVSAGTGCYRHIQISDGATLCELHTAIIDAFDFYCDEYMAHAFFMDNRIWSPKDAFFSDGIDDMLRSTSKYTLKKLKVHSGGKFKYLFDFEEEHRMQCKVLRELQENTTEAKVIRSVGEDPQQHFGCDNAEADSDDSFDEYFPEEYSKEVLEIMYERLGVPAETVNLLREYFDCAAELYGIIPLRKLLDIYNTHNTPVSENDFLRVAEVFRHEHHTYAILGQEALYEDAPFSAPIDRELVAQHLYYDDLEDYYALAEGQQGKPFYIPEKEEFLRASTDQCYPETVQSKKMLAYLRKKKLRCPPEEVLLEMQDLLNVDWDFNDIAEDMARLGLQCASLQDAQTFFGLLADLNNHTRKLVNRGHAPVQLSRTRSEQNKTYQNLRVLSNNKPIAEPPIAIEQPLVIPPLKVVSSKPSRNGPCPCGSGRKFKNCCGK